MLKDVIKLGDKVNIKMLNSISEREYQSKLLDLVDDETVSVAMPIEKNQVILLEIGQKYRLTFYTERGLYTSLSVVTKRYKSQNIYIAELKTLEAPKRIQRREFFRFHCVMEIDYCSIPEPYFHAALERIFNSNTRFGLTSQQEKIRAVELLKDMDVRQDTNIVKMQHAVLIDISGGGMKFRTQKEIENPNNLYLVFSLDHGLSYLRVFGNIIATEKSVDQPNYYEHRLKFTDISGDERENIVRYILNEERKIRQKEKGYC